MFKVVTALCVALLAVFIDCKPGAAEPLNLCAIPHGGAQKEARQYRSVANFLSQQLNVPVSFIPTSTYQDALNLFIEGKVHLCWFGGLTGVLAVEKVPGAATIAQGFEDKYFKSFLIARRNLKLTAQDSLPSNTKQLSLLFGPQLSTSGRLMPEYFIRKLLGQSSENAFREIGFSNNHDDTIARVNRGEYDLGFVNYREWLHELQLGHITNKEMIVIWETPTYPDYHWVLHPDVTNILPAPAKALVVEAITAMNAHASLMKVFKRSHFVTANNQDYVEIKAIAKDLKLLN